MPKHMDLGDDDWCFACGKSNECGLQLDFDMEGEEYVTYFTPQKRHQGYINIVHGGIVSTIMDEVMARYLHILGENAVTGEINVKFRRPAIVGHKLRFAGKLEDAKSRLLLCSARATDEDGTLIAEAVGKMVRVRKDG